MANPIAVPGSNVPSGAAVSPGGAQGVQGLQGVIGESYPIGVIVPYTSTTAPPTWMICDGSAISRATYPALFSLIGTTFGTGDGSTTFNLPDLRGRVGVGAGQGASLTNRVLAAKGGEETHQLVVAEMPSHTHDVYYQANAAAGGVGTGVSGSGAHAGSATTPTGGDGAHNTMPPFVVVAYIIKVSSGGGATAQAPIADTTQSGLLRQVSGLSTDFIDGTNHPVDLGATILGQASVTNAGLTKSLIVPSFANHPDALWTPMNAFDDHFDPAGAVNAKWASSMTSGMINTILTQGGSELLIAGGSSTADSTIYQYAVQQALPNHNPFTITLKAEMDFQVYPNAASPNNIYTMVGIKLMDSTGNYGAWIYCVTTYQQSGQPYYFYYASQILFGQNFGSVALYGLGGRPLYYRFVYLASNVLNIYGSRTGRTWYLLYSLTGAQTGLTSNPPAYLQLAVQSRWFSQSALQVDWVRFTNP